MQTRRKILAGVGALSLSGLSGCMGLLGGITGGSDDGESTGGLTTDTDHTIVSTDQGISGWVRSISHNPNGSMARVTGAIDVEEERDYRVRLGVIDEEGVVLGDEITTETLFPTGTNTVTVEIDDVEDCGECHSGLLQVNYPEEGGSIGGGGSTDSSDDSEDDREDDSDSSSSSSSTMSSNSDNESESESEESNESRNEEKNESDGDGGDD